VDGETEGERDGGNMIQPNTMGFAELVNAVEGSRKCAQQQEKISTMRLRVTATVVQEFLQCPICGGVVRDALILPWDQRCDMWSFTFVTHDTKWLSLSTGMELKAQTIT
jgi:hypothetical protein